MSTLTKQEREGLDDVFLSIHTDNNRYIKLKNISALILSKKNSIDYKNLFKEAKIGLNETKTASFLSNITKKKKNLSK